MGKGCGGLLGPILLVEIQNKLCLVSIGGHDTPQWTVSKSSKFSYSDTWNAIHIKHNQVEWWYLNWFSLSIPKQAFVAWLVMKDAWLIGRKLLNWVYKGEVKCVFCRYPMALCNVLNPHTLWDDIVDL
jgi:hypothetical protein